MHGAKGHTWIMDASGLPAAGSLGKLLDRAKTEYHTALRSLSGKMLCHCGRDCVTGFARLFGGRADQQLQHMGRTDPLNFTWGCRGCSPGTSWSALPVNLTQPRVN